MSIQIPGWLHWLEWVAGSDWPTGDEDRMWDLAADLRSARDELRDILPDLDAALELTLTAYPAGAGRDRMDARLQALRSGDGSAEHLAEVYGQLADAADDMALQIQTAKLNVIGALTWLAAEIAAAWAFPPTAPAQEAAAIARTQTAAAGIRRAAMSAIESGLTRLVGARAARFLTLPVYEIAQEAVVEAVQGVTQAVLVQGIQITQGHRDGFDADEIMSDALTSALAAGFAAPVGHALGNVVAGTALPNIVRGLLPGAGAGAAGVAAGWGAGGVLTGNWEFDPRMATGGVLGGALPGAVHGAGGGTGYSNYFFATDGVSAAGDRPRSSIGAVSDRRAGTATGGTPLVGPSSGSDGAGKPAGAYRPSGDSVVREGISRAGAGPSAEPRSVASSPAGEARGTSGPADARSQPPAAGEATRRSMVAPESRAAAGSAATDSGTLRGGPLRAQHTGTEAPGAAQRGDQVAEPTDRSSASADPDAVPGGGAHVTAVERSAPDPPDTSPDQTCGPEALATVVALTDSPVVRVPGDEVGPAGMPADLLESAAGGRLQAFDSHDAIATRLRELGDGAVALVVDEYGDPLDEYGVGAHAYVMAHSDGVITVHDRFLGGPHPFRGGEVAANVRGVHAIAYDAAGNPVPPARAAETVSAVSSGIGSVEPPDSGQGDEFGPPRPLTSDEIQHVHGIPAPAQWMFQRFADLFGIYIDVRPTNVDSLPRLLSGEAVPKSQAIKNKTMSDLDVPLRGRSEAKGLAACFEPRLPADLSGYDPSERAALERRYRQRLEEWENRHKIEDSDEFRIRDQVIQAKCPDGEWRPIAGDHDLFAVGRPAGRTAETMSWSVRWELGHATADELAELGRLSRSDLEDLSQYSPSVRRIVEMMGRCIDGVQHGTHLMWEERSEKDEAIFVNILSGHLGPEGEPLVRFRPRLAPIEVWAPPRDTWDRGE
ncbi:hypothetical protein [Nocardia sp. BMG51109]|uniref:WXG100-like domain-containing protein n=1 Tax=Nocardia sp. BMG51109 TaxID=1056816 RepID=UPI000464AD9E|nr:hypothetical protein [Nocardia sp. BMG51109]